MSGLLTKNAFGPEYQKIQTVFKRDERNCIVPWEWTCEEFDYLSDAPWRWTEKVDGTNIRLHWNGETVTVGGRTDNAQVPAQLVANIKWLTSNTSAWRDIFGDTPATIYGEGYGAKIQSGGYYRPDQGFIAFDVHIGGCWLKDDLVGQITEKLQVECVPFLGTFSLRDAVEKVRDGAVSSAWPGAPIEGLVGRPCVQLFNRSGARIVAKVKVKDWRDYERKSQRQSSRSVLSDTRQEQTSE